MTETQEKMVEVSDKIKKATTEFNLLISEASKLNLYISVEQKFHPLSNVNGAPINPPLKITITEKVNY